MARNGSGTMSILNSFTSGETISSDDMDANFSDIASEITNSVAKDGQTTMTGQFKAASGTVSLPGITFGSDTDVGFYRIGADNIGLAIGGAIALDVDSNSLNMASGFTIAAQAITATTVTPSGQVVSSAGTVSAPGLAFASDLDCGFYRIGANNIGWAVNGAKVVDVSTTGQAVTGTLTATGAITGASTVTDVNGLLPFPATTAMIFVQTSAPTGWTKVTSTDNAALRLVSGTASSGGTANFTTAFTSRSIAEANLPNVTKGVSGTVTSTPSVGGVTPVKLAHVDSATLVDTDTGDVNVYTTDKYGTLQIANVFSSGVTSALGSGTAMDFAVKYVDVIHATKN